MTAACASVVIGLPQRSQATRSKVRPQIVRVVAVSTIGMQSVGHSSTQEPQPTQSGASFWPKAGPTCLVSPRPIAASAL